MTSLPNKRISILPHGIYDALLDEGLHEMLRSHPELRSILDKLDPEEEPFRYASFVAGVIEQALRCEIEPIERLNICNQLIEIVSGTEGRAHLSGKKLVSAEKSILLEITPPHYAGSRLPRPETPMVISSLFTGSPREPHLVHELQSEMCSTDRVDVLVSFIKWSGLRLLMAAFEELRIRNIPVRVITTSYMGASDAAAIEWLARLANVRVKVSYDTQRTRLHAKAYHFYRESGFSTAYIGSANMSHPAMTSGLEWNLKVTAQDMPHILEKFSAEFETYWNSPEFILFDHSNPEPLRKAIQQARHSKGAQIMAFFDLRPHAFQERILDALEIERNVHGIWRNLIIAATGTGKTVIAAFDFKRFFEKRNRQANLLFVAHRREILEQAISTFRNVLRISDFGDLLVGPHEADRMEHLFCSIDMITSRRICEQVDRSFYDYIVIDEVHHGPASSYRIIFDYFQPQILLGLTATPERMDGESVAADFNNRFAAEIRLPEALEEKLLCPFHYFGVADGVNLDADVFWKNGKYDVKALENVYTGAHTLALQRLNTILDTLLRYEPDLSLVHGIGFCVSIKHAEFMAQMFNERKIPSAVLIGDTKPDVRATQLQDFRNGELIFLFTVDVLNEGLDIPFLNTVMFLRPTESLTVFLQQLGRGLRPFEGKDCLTVLDFVGQAHRKYRIDTKLKALLPKTRFGIDNEIEQGFPHIPPGCSIQFDRIARKIILENIRQNLKNLRTQIPERLQTFENETRQKLTFKNFVDYNDYEPESFLSKGTWTEWKARARLLPSPNDPDISFLRKSLLRSIFITGPRERFRLRRIIEKLREKDHLGAISEAGDSALAVHYRLWGVPGDQVDVLSIDASLSRFSRNESVMNDFHEILEWSSDKTRIGGLDTTSPFFNTLELHAQYANSDIKAALGKISFESAGQTGVGVLPYPDIKAIVLLITFQKSENEFSPTTMYADYPISREILHWESQSNTTQESESGKNLIKHKERGYTILVFVRDVKKRNGVAVPFTYLGPADLISYDSERPIKIIWQMRYPMPVEIFEENRRGG